MDTDALEAPASHLNDDYVICPAIGLNAINDFD